jgi:hypothetical protein
MLISKGIQISYSSVCNVITNLKLGQNAIENWATDDRQS